MHHKAVLTAAIATLLADAAADSMLPRRKVEEGDEDYSLFLPSPRTAVAVFRYESSRSSIVAMRGRAKGSKGRTESAATTAENKKVTFRDSIDDEGSHDERRDSGAALSVASVATTSTSSSSSSSSEYSSNGLSLNGHHTTNGIAAAESRRKSSLASRRRSWTGPLQERAHGALVLCPPMKERIVDGAGVWLWRLYLLSMLLLALHSYSISFVLTHPRVGFRSTSVRK